MIAWISKLVYQNVEKCPIFFSCDFLLFIISCFIAILATLGFSGTQTHVSKKKKSHVKKLNSFHHFGNISTDSERNKNLIFFDDFFARKN